MGIAARPGKGNRQPDGKLIATEAEERELFQAELKRYVEEDL